MARRHSDVSWEYKIQLKGTVKYSTTTRQLCVNAVQSFILKWSNHWTSLNCVPSCAHQHGPYGDEFVGGGIRQTIYSGMNTRCLCTVIHRHLKQLTRRLSSNNNNKNTDRKGGRPSITLLHAAHNFLPIKISVTEEELSAQILLIYRTIHHLKQTKYGISQHSNLCHRWVIISYHRSTPFHFLHCLYCRPVAGEKRKLCDARIWNEFADSSDIRCIF